MTQTKRSRRTKRESAWEGCRGWVYVFDNEAVLNRVKIGFTLNNPESRVRNQQETGYAFPHVVQYLALVDNPHRVERRVHAELAAWRKTGEWFEVSLNRAIDVIRQHAPAILFEDETPRWHPALHPPTDFARTRLQRERQSEKRASDSAHDQPTTTRGEDIVRQVGISAEMARNGCGIPIPLPKEGQVMVRCPAGISNHTALRVRGCGYFSLNGGPRGDLIVLVHIR
jgi:hypothetical protein